ncbi:hypothetical protein ACWFMI_24965 [Nocardiopsis terrae]|uniref:hypothetical protein n=1 Tax=Streptomyces sp. NPDC057554 TaxID=3350538 RepID=UPI00367BE0D4
MLEIAQPMRDLVAKQTGDTDLATLVHKAISQAYQMGQNRALEDAAADLDARAASDPWALAGVHAGADAAAMVRARKTPVDPPPPDGVRIEPTTYRVSCLPTDHPGAHHFTVCVEWRGGDLWAITRHGLCLSSAGDWEYETRPSERTDEWLADHRFSYPEAMRRARKIAPTLTVMGRTVTDVLAQEAPDET